MVGAVRLPLVTLACLAALSACKGTSTKPVDTPPPPPPPKCGDGNVDVDAGEACDLSNLAGASCQSLGFDTGSLGCDATCQFATTSCVKRCGNGVQELGEACDGDAGLMPCAQFGYLACTAACQVDARHCVATGFEDGPALAVTKGGPAVVGDLSPPGPGDLVMAVPSFGRVEVFPWVTPTGFDGAGGRKLSFLRTPERALACDVDGDGNDDVATINADGTFDHYVFGGSSFSLQPIDAGCPGGTFLGAGAFAADAGRRAVAFGCGALWVLGPGAAREVPTADAGAAALVDVDADGLTEILWVDPSGPALAIAAPPDFAPDGGLALPALPEAIAAGDLDADGDVDLAAVVGGEVRLYENTGAGFAPRGTFPAAGAADLRVVDLDLDGRPDVLWTVADQAVLRRNRGDWLFSALTVPLPSGPRLSFDVGDVDGDGDEDLVATVSAGGDATRTSVVLNRVR